MKNIMGKKVICKRCEEEFDEEYRLNKRRDTLSGED